MPDLTLDHAQRGLAYFPDHAVYCSVRIGAPPQASHPAWQALARELDAHCATGGYRTVVLLGVGFALWSAWCRAQGRDRPLGLGDEPLLTRLAPAFADTGGDLWFHVKSDDAEAAAATARLIAERLQPLHPQDLLAVAADKRHGGKVLGGRFTDGLENPADAEDLSARVLIGDADPANRGGAFLITQKFVHDWELLDAMTELAKQDMIGRDQQDRLLAIDDESSHVKRVRQLDGERLNFRLVRQALPYGRVAGDRSKEEGVYFAGYSQSTAALDRILQGIAGDRPGMIRDRLFGVTHADAGSIWYVPSREQCGLAAAGGRGNAEITMNEYFDVRSGNGLMFYNARDYQHKVRGSRLVGDCPISDRILALLNKQFSRWQDTWYKPRETPPLGHLRDHLDAADAALLAGPVMLRKGKATQLSLARVLVAPDYAGRANLLRIDPDELIVGNLPQLSLGIGTQVMEYLDDDERLAGFFGMINEYSATGHNVPDYPRLLREGIGAIADAHRARIAASVPPARDFHQAVVWSLEGLQAFIEAHARRADEMAAGGGLGAGERARLGDIAARLRRVADAAPAGFVDALQLVFIVNAALHQVGEPHSIGRLDQMLIDLYEADRARGAITPEAAQEAIDAFWLKMDETVLYNHRHLNDYLTYGTGAVFYSGGNFPQGAAINQWVQQVTVGGYKADDGAEPQDGANVLTTMCLRAARRLPLNAPCLSLRLHAKSSDALIAEAARALLSGGAHPVLLNDDKVLPALAACGPLARADVRDYCCDGCFEPVIVGKTEWAFSYVPLLPMVDYALNQGSTVQAAGPVNLRGLKSSWNSPPAEAIHSFEQFLDIFFTHWRWAVSAFFNSLMNNYGSLATVCPSPLFSALLSDTLETGRDLTEGGARYHVVAPMMCGIADTIDSLFAIRRLVFDADSARCSLPQLLRALQCDWGHDMKPPFYTALEGPLRRDADAAAFGALREAALALPKFGIDADPAVRELATRVVGRCVATIHEVFRNPLPSIRAAYERLQARYGTPQRPFEFTVTPGIGTFEDNVGLGMGFGASANGRRSGQPIAADCSAMPLPPDRPYTAVPRDAFAALADWNIAPIGQGLANAAPNDLNIGEDFPPERLEELLRRFARSETGSNMMTITCADPATYEQAARFPERYDLLRVRTGGWSEFYVAMFDFHQEYIRRRAWYGPGSAG